MVAYQCESVFCAVKIQVAAAKNGLENMRNFQNIIRQNPKQSYIKEDS